MTSPKNPTKYLGPNVYLANIVVRNRPPTTADYRQPETGTNYVIFTGWQVGKDPVSGSEGDLYLLSKIVANQAYWLQITSGVTPSGAVLSLSDTAGTLVYPEMVGDVGNIQLEATAGLTITADAPNNKLIFALTGGGIAIDQIQVQAATVPGVNPVSPNSNGLMTVNGAVVANHSVPIESRTRAVNTYNVEVQYATSAASTDGTKSGLSHFNSTQFSVDASGFVSTTAAFSRIVSQVFTSNGTYTPTAGMKYCIIEACGAGGGGGGAALTGASTISVGGGGGGGAYTRAVYTAATIGASKAVTVGAGGTAGSTAGGNGGIGGSSSVAGLLGANGGTGGNGSAAVASAISNGGNGGSSGSGDINTSGNDGSWGMGDSAVFPGVATGSGGGSYFCGAAKGFLVTVGTNGLDGRDYGGGGSGAGNYLNQGTGKTGGVGGNGVVIVTEFI